MEIIIRNAIPGDASYIADAVMTAVGEEICRELAGSEHSRMDVKTLFTQLASQDDSQYSWRNSRVAVDKDGNIMGICVSYDGADLKRLRRAFFKESKKRLGWTFTDVELEMIEPETTEDEFYLDSLAVWPQYKKQGVGTALIKDALKKAIVCNKPLGLLVDDDNPEARRLYESIGFREVAKRPFAGVLMSNLRLPMDL